MYTKVLIVAIVKKGDAVLMRKKPDGSPPYSETWYIIGAELIAGSDPYVAIIDTVKSQSGVDIRVDQKFYWDSEVKHDVDGIMKQFVYLDVLCDYVSGDLIASEGIEKLEWVPLSTLNNYDIVPPSVKVFKKLGWLS